MSVSNWRKLDEATKFLPVAISFIVGGCCCPSITSQPAGSPANQVLQEFEVGGAETTAWRVNYVAVDKYGLYITGAWFRRGSAEPWIRVLYEARVAEIFVPYHPGSPRYYDIQTFDWPLVTVTDDDAGCCGQLLGDPPKVVKEIRDRGVGWKDDDTVYRGRELVLWSTLDAANYNYIFQYGFRDDGTVTFRVGATARNLPGYETVAHTHTAVWKVDIDLDGPANDSTQLASHDEPAGSLSATDTTVQFNGGVEGFADWAPEKFHELRVIDELRTNANGRNIGYDLKPLRHGNARHRGINETFAQHDFWVTRYAPGQITAQQLPSYVNGQSITNSDVVLWHVTPLHHQPRDEDGRFVGGVWKGVALTMWGGFDLRPRNLFSSTPQFPEPSPTAGLIITRTGSGSGAVTSNPIGVNCPTDCSHNYAIGTSVTLTPRPDAGSVFTTWMGNADCSDGVVTMNADRTCRALFEDTDL